MTIKTNSTSPAKLFGDNSTSNNNARSPHSIRLRSPKGTCHPNSPSASKTTTKRNQRNYNRFHYDSWLPCSFDSLWLFVSRQMKKTFLSVLSQGIKPKNKFFLAMFLFLFAIAYISTLYRPSITTSTDTIQKYLKSPILIPANGGDIATLTSIRQQDQQFYQDVSYNDAGIVNDTNAARILFDSSVYPIIAKSVHQPKSSNPIEVIYIGRHYGQIDRSSSSSNYNQVQDDKQGKDENEAAEEYDDDELLDGLQRSSYIKVVSSFMYTQTIPNRKYPTTDLLLIHKQYHDYTLPDASTSLHKSQNRHSTIATAEAIVDVSSATTITIIVDWSALLRDCHTLQRILATIYETHLKDVHRLPLKKSTSVMLLIVLLDASPSSQAVTCTTTSGTASHGTYLMQLPIRYQIRLVKRSIVTNRRYNYTKKWIESGTLIPNYIHQPQMLSNHSIYHNNIIYWSGYVSQSFIFILDSVTQKRLGQSRGGDTLLSRLKKEQRKILQNLVPMNHHDRPIYVAHYWKASRKRTNDDSVIHQQYNRLRQHVRSIINSTRLEIAASNAKKITKDDPRWVESVGIDTQVELVTDEENIHSGSNDNEGDDDTNGKQDFAKAVHIAVLASSKIVVVSQADEYEDCDNRLMEALASGAMVLCDAMIVPPNGLIHKTNIVFFNSTTNLKRYIQYYLHPKNEKKRQEIARHGMEYALGRHRSWHVLEAVLFGKALTRTDKYPLIDIGPDRRKPTKGVHPIILKL